MDSVIIKLVQSLGMPGIIVVVILYFIWSQKFITIIRASEVEKLFFTHEKKLIHKAWSWISFSVAIFVVIVGIALILLSLMQQVRVLATGYVARIVYGLIITVVIASLLLYSLRSNRKIRGFIEWINTKEAGVGTIVSIYFFTAILFFTYEICYEYINKMPQLNKELVILTNALIISVFTPKALVFLVKPWIYREETYFYFKDCNEDEKIWYLIKPINDSDFLVGDNFSEDKCERLKFINFEEMRKKEILIDRKHFPR